MAMDWVPTPASPGCSHPAQSRQLSCPHCPLHQHPAGPVACFSFTPHFPSLRFPALAWGPIYPHSLGRALARPPCTPCPLCSVPLSFLCVAHSRPPAPSPLQAPCLCPTARLMLPSSGPLGGGVGTETEGGSASLRDLRLLSEVCQGAHPNTQPSADGRDRGQPGQATV